MDVGVMYGWQSFKKSDNSGTGKHVEQSSQSLLVGL